MFGLLIMTVGQWMFFYGVVELIGMTPRKLYPVYLFGMLTFNSAMFALLNR